MKFVELQKDVEIKDNTWLVKKYKGLDPSKASDNANQRLIALAIRLRGYTREAEVKKINSWEQQLKKTIAVHKCLPVKMNQLLLAVGSYSDRLNTMKDTADHERYPRGNSTIQSLTNNLTHHNMENTCCGFSIQLPNYGTISAST